MPTWIQNLIFTLVGAVLGIAADEAKRWLSRRTELSLAKTGIYDELATYIADLEQILSGPGVDFRLFRRVRSTVPRLDVIEWYKANRFDLFLRLDRGKGIRMMHDETTESVRDLAADRTVKGQDTLLSRVRDEVFALDHSYLKKRIAVIQKRAKQPPVRSEP